MTEIIFGPPTAKEVIFVEDEYFAWNPGKARLPLMISATLVDFDFPSAGPHLRCEGADVRGGTGGT